MTLAAVSLPYYRYIMPYGLKKFTRYAVNVWGVNSEGKTDEQVAQEGLLAMENWMKNIGLVKNISELGANEQNLEGIVKSILVMDGGYKVLNEDEIRNILKASM